MNISLTKHFEDFVAASVGTGRFKSSSEVVREALRLLEERELELALLRRDLGIGRQDVSAGRIKPFDADAIKASGRSKLAD